MIKTSQQLGEVRSALNTVVKICVERCAFWPRKRGRRAIRREYADALSEVAEGGEAPAFADFVGELREDPLFGRWFSTAADKSVEKSAQTAEPVEKSKPKRKPASNPNAGTTTPKPPDTEVSLNGYRAQRQKLGRKATLAANLELLKKQGLIS